MAFDIPMQPQAPVRPKRFTVRTQQAIAGIFALGVLGLCVSAFIASPPASFESNSLVAIPEDASAAQFAHVLKETHIIRSETAFRVLARVSRYDRHLDPGAYVFQKPLNLLSVLYRVGNAKHGIDPVRITFTEGMTSFDIADTLEKELPGFDKAAFLNEASTSEGYLFPETYDFMPSDTPRAIVNRLKIQFSESISAITPQIMASKHSVSDIVIMASILEREAKSEDDKRLVAGILWNRINKGQPLQVDASFGYAHKENGYTPTADDLDSDSPYNTYRNKGLPPTPISNPGLESLLAAATPATTKFFYYLTGKDGKMHYAQTFEQHKKNRALYLD